MGEPGGKKSRHPKGGNTRGSETSQYPEEKKSREILQVVASERGKAQTRKLAFWGCRTALES